MPVGLEQPTFDDEDYIYEWKLDNIRYLLYLNKDNTELRDKYNLKLSAKFPELTQLYKQVETCYMLGGELYVFRDREPDFFQVQKRTLTSDPSKVCLHSRRFPASFTAFDIPYHKDASVIDQPLVECKQLLEEAVRENDRLPISRYIETDGIAPFELTKQRGLEGIVAKCKDSRYACRKHTKDWTKCKNLMDDDFIVCDYTVKEKGIASLIPAQYDQHYQVVYKGHVTAGASPPYLMEHSEKTNTNFLTTTPKGDENAVRIDPSLVGTIKSIQYTEQGGLRQPIPRGFREDKAITDYRNR